MEKQSNKTSLKRVNFLPFSKPTIEKEEIEAVVETLKSGWITTGPKTQEFEKAFAGYINNNPQSSTQTKVSALAVSSCTAALHLALVVAGIKPGDEVITTPFTFPSTANMIIQAGGKPVFADIDLQTYNIDPEQVYIKISEHTKALLPVHYGGLSCDMTALSELAKKNNLMLIEDAAHALETIFVDAKNPQKAQKIGTIGDFTAFSFYATKNITTSEGGMLTSANLENLEKARMLANHGLSKNAWKRYMKDAETEGPLWQLLEPGFKYNMTDIQAAIGLVQIRKVDKWWLYRQEIVSKYTEAFADIPELILRSYTGKSKPAHHLFTILINTDKLNLNRDGFRRALAEANIASSVHFYALHEQPYFQQHYKMKHSDYPNAAYVSERILSLPLYVSMAEDDVQDVIFTVKNIIQKSKINKKFFNSESRVK